MQSPTSRDLLKRLRKYPRCKSAYKYALSVVEGKIPACKLTKLACKRFLDDLEKQSEVSYPFYFDLDKGERICDFAEMLPHVKGKWARNDILHRLIVLEPWQCFMFSQITGWLEKKTGLRRYREAYIEVPRKNGKSIVAAVIGLYFFLVDKEPGAEIYCGATTEKQALEVFRPARRMCELRPTMRKQFDIAVLKQQLKLADESLFQPIIGKPGDGSSPHLAILDEYHEHPDSTAYDAMQTGMGAREQPLLLIITTAGFNIESPCHEEHIECERLLNGVITDERKFALIYSIDKEDNPYTLEALKKANPNYGVSVLADYLQRQADTAKRSPASQNKYLVKHLNVWTTSDSAFFNIVKWQEQADATLRQEDFKECRSIFAVDLAKKIDMCAIVHVFVRQELNGKHYYCFATHYLPEDTINDEESPNFKIYQKFIRTKIEDEPVLTEMIGAETNFEDLKDILVEDSIKYTPGEVCFDPWNATMLMQMCERESLPVVEFPQNTRNLSLGMKEVESALAAGRIHHNGDPVLTWCMSNVVAHEDRNGNYFPDKSRKTYKIDGAIALIMAVARASMMDGLNFGEAIEQGYGVRTI